MKIIKSASIQYLSGLKIQPEELVTISWMWKAQSMNSDPTWHIWEENW